MSRELLARAWSAGAGPGDGPLTIDLDSTICETYGLAKEGARDYGYTGQRGYHGFITDRDGDTLELEADHRRHAEIENAIRDPASSAGQALTPSTPSARIKCGAGSEVRRRAQPSPLRPLPRQRRLAGGAGDRPQPCMVRRDATDRSNLG